MDCGLPGSSAAADAKLLQSCPTLCDPIEGSPPGSPVPGILQARTLECASPVPGAHSSLKPAALPAFPVEGAFPPNTLEPLPFRTVKPEVRTWQLAFSPSGIFLLRTKESSTAPIKPSPRHPVWNSAAGSLGLQGNSFLQDGQRAQELPRHGPPCPPTLAPLDGADCRETGEKHAGLVPSLPLLLPSRFL